MSTLAGKRYLVYIVVHGQAVLVSSVDSAKDANRIARFHAFWEPL